MAFRITKARPSRAAFAASVVTGVALLVGSSASAATVKPDKVTTSTSGGCGTVPSHVAPDAPPTTSCRRCPKRTQRRTPALRTIR